MNKVFIVATFSDIGKDIWNFHVRLFVGDYEADVLASIERYKNDYYPSREISVQIIPYFDAYNSVPIKDFSK